MKQNSWRSGLVVLLWGCLLVTCDGKDGSVTSTPTPTLTAQLTQGKQLFRQHCGSCHAIEPDTVIVGPSLFAMSERAAERAPELAEEQYVELSILQPGAFVVPGYDNLMPSNFTKRLNSAELDAIVAYVLSLH